MTQINTRRIGPAPFIAINEAGAGETVIFLHGIGGNKRNWDDNLPAFATRFRPAAWDARGYGDSDDYDGPLDVLDFPRDLARVLDALGAERAHVVGLSMGGRIAMDFAALHPDRLLTLTLCDTHTGMTHWSEEKKAEFVRLRREPLIAGAEPKDIAIPVARSLIGPNAVPGAFEKLVDSLSRLHKDSYIKTVEASVRAEAVGRLGDIKVPTLVVCGEDDRLTTPLMAREIAAAVPGAELAIIPQAGHLVNIEQPEAFNRTVLAFLDRHGEASGPRHQGRTA